MCLRHVRKRVVRKKDIGVNACCAASSNVHLCAQHLMSRAGVQSDHAERCLGHVLPGIRATYDKHEYRDEKRRAFEALASLVERIVNPQANIVPLQKPADVKA